MITAKSKIFCVIGNPIGHSKSPIIHNFIFQKIGVDGVYIAFEVKDLKTFFSFVRDVDIKGISITIPHKVESMKFVDKVDDFAIRIGAINTIKNTNGYLEGYNTDIEGVIKAFETRGIKSLKGKSILVIGTGGVARSSIWAFIKMNTDSIIVAGRNQEKVTSLVNEVKRYFQNIEGITIDKIPSVISNISVIANCTPLGMTPNIEDTPINISLINNNHIVFDTIYTPVETKLIKSAQNSNAKVIYGIDMFVFQALEQQKIWLNNPEVYSLKDAVINLLSQTH